MSPSSTTLNSPCIAAWIDAMYVPQRRLIDVWISWPVPSEPSSAASGPRTMSLYVYYVRTVPESIACFPRPFRLGPCVIPSSLMTSAMLVLLWLVCHIGTSLVSSSCACMMFSESCQRDSAPQVMRVSQSKFRNFAAFWSTLQAMSPTAPSSLQLALRTFSALWHHFGS